MQSSVSMIFACNAACIHHFLLTRISTKSTTYHFHISISSSALMLSLWHLWKNPRENVVVGTENVCVLSCYVMHVTWTLRNISHSHYSLYFCSGRWLVYHPGRRTGERSTAHARSAHVFKCLVMIPMNPHLYLSLFFWTSFFQSRINKYERVQVSSGSFTISV